MSYPPPPPPPPPAQLPGADWPPPPGSPAPYPPYPPKRSRSLPAVGALVVGALVVAAALVVPLLVLGDDDQSSAGGGTGPAGSESAAVDTSNLDLVEEYGGLDTTHEEGDLSYPQSPPVGGPHSGAWLACGVYEEPVREENLVHDLEHGTVFLSYRPDLVDDAGVGALTAQLPENGILAPYDDQEAPVVITVWGRQLELLGPDDPRIGLFIDEFGAGDTAPEPFASCAGGTRDPSGGTAA